jgi:hypothetical protein
MIVRVAWMRHLLPMLHFMLESVGSHGGKHISVEETRLHRSLVPYHTELDKGSIRDQIRGTCAYAQKQMATCLWTMVALL